MQSFNWDPIKLVVFDVDGTLYSQKKLRPRMARDLLLSALWSRSTRAVRVLSAYRKIRERLGDEEVREFEPVLLGETAQCCGVSEAEVAAIVAEWMERRPLAYMADCCFPGIPQLFERLRTGGKTIGILSDYPAHAKLRAFGLSADVVVCAGDPGVGVLKPHPQGLERVMELAGIPAGATVMIGDRIERDGDAARRIGVQALIKSNRPAAGWHTFSSYHDAIFSAT